MQKEIHARVEGRVIMVMFRDFTKRKARALGLRGFVKNMDDGTVRVVAQGNEENLRIFIEHLRVGSLLSRVDTVAVEWGGISREFSEFEIEYE